jgi:hypothetical protein
MNKFNSLLLVALYAVIYMPSAIAANADAHAPIGVMLDHQHNKGEWMLSYRYMDMHMNELLDGSKTATSQQLSTYTMVPTAMQMNMHMLGAMYGLSDSLTLVVMTSILAKDMDTAMDSMRSSGMGDLKVSGIYGIYADETKRLLLNLGLSVPTASIDETNTMGKRFAYAMQFGSGSYGLLPGLSYIYYFKPAYSYGAQVNAHLPLNDNKYDYKLGNKYNLTTWLAYAISSSLSVSSRLNYTNTQAIEGKDTQLMMNMSPVNNPELYAGEVLKVALGLNWIFHTNNGLNEHRLALELDTPVYFNLTGPQMAPCNSLVIGWQKAW